MYNPPVCNAINFTIDGVYSIPACDGLNFDIGGTGPVDIVVAHSDVEITSNISVFFTGEIVSPESSQVQVLSQVTKWELVLEFVGQDSEFIFDVDSGICEGTNPDIPGSSLRLEGKIYPWGTPDYVSEDYCTPWGLFAQIEDRYCVPYGGLRFPVVGVCVGWEELESVWFLQCSGWREGVEVFYSVCSSSIIWMLDQDVYSCFGWEEPELYKSIYCSGYLTPPNKDIESCYFYGDTQWVANILCGAYNVPKDNDRYFCTSWGPFSYYLLCFQNSLDKYIPPYPCDSIQFGFPSKYELHEGVCEGISFELNNYATHRTDPRCQYHYHHSGIRDNNPIINVTPSNFPPAYGVYMMLNYCYVTEIISGKPINISAVSAVLDKHSWTWQFSVEVTSAECMELLKPSAGSYAHLKININGVFFTMTVESWKENRSASSKSWSVTGRSPGIIFARPWSNISGKIDTGKQGGQIIDDFVQGKSSPVGWPDDYTTWNTDWSRVQNSVDGFNPYGDWYIPADTISYSNTSEIQVFQKIIQSIGAIMYFDKDSPTLRIAPLYSQQPWNWDNNHSIDYKYLLSEQFEQVGRSSEVSPVYRAVHVLGGVQSANSSNNGADSDVVFVKVYRDGYSGVGTSEYAPMVTEDALTTTKAARERGRHVIGATGEWVRHTLNIGVFCPTDSNLGLFEPGYMVAVSENMQVWRGVVSSVQLTAWLLKGVVSVSQVIEVDEYRGD